MEERVLKTQVISDPVLQLKIWETYKNSFANTDDYCAQDQICYDEKTMKEALLDTDYWKFVLFLGDEPIGLCLMTSNLVKARIAYCNDRFLTRKYPNYVSAGRLYYVTAICVLPDMQKRGKGIELLKTVCQHIFDYKAMVAYDYSENKNSSLTGLITYVGKKLGWEIIEVPLDRQCYTSLYYQHDGKPS